jgi:hypothetical protein
VGWLTGIGQVHSFDFTVLDMRGSGSARSLCLWRVSKSRCHR